MTTFAPETRFGHYRILRLLGQGGMADVYEAEDEAIGRVVALKILPAAFARDQERAGRFRREIEASAQLDHPHIVSIHDIGRVDELHYYTMTLLPGGDLRWLLRAGPLTPAEAVAIACRIADALDYAHRCGVIHRDIKPENILFDADGNAVLTDFGIARLADADTRMTGTGMTIGTPHYMSPEQVRGAAVDARSDLYSLGVVLFEMLAGQVPFDAGDGYAIGYQHLNAEIPRLAPELGSFQKPLDALLAKRSRKRPRSAGAVPGMLRAALAGIDTVPVVNPGVSGRGSRRQSLYWALGGVTAALVVVASLAVLELQTRPTIPVGGGSVRPSMTQPRTPAASRPTVDATLPMPAESLGQATPAPQQAPSAFVGGRHADPRIRATMSRLSAFTQTSAVVWLPVVGALEETSELLARATGSSITRHLLQDSAIEAHIEALRVLSSDMNRALGAIDDIPRDLLELETELTRYEQDPSAANLGALHESIEDTLAQGERINAALGVIERSLSGMRKRLQAIVDRGTRSVLGEALFRSAVDSERTIADGIEQVRDDRGALDTYLNDVRALQGWLRATTNQPMDETR